MYFLLAWLKWFCVMCPLTLIHNVYIWFRVNFVSKNDDRHWLSSSLIKYLPYRHRDLSFDPPELKWKVKPGVVVPVWNPNAREAEMGLSLNSVARQPRLIGWFMLAFFFLCMFVCTCACVGVHAPMWRPEADVWRFPVSLSGLFYQTGTLVEPRV